MTLKNDYEKIIKWEKASEPPEKIINKRHSHFIKADIGYDHTKCDDKKQYSVAEGKSKSRHTSPRSTTRSVPKNKGWFYGYCFSFNQFNHKATGCRSSMQNKTRRFDKFQHINRNCKKIWRKRESQLEM